ncbi:hypothetical protein PsorP6_017159 [Peronosclerospora sorghi]|uniref:Uncharacterized protein n=1 Tax=Peronosclerospora sorghi TaxID=230839 RepID=A0ACC0WF74_9STRA|nr:hypothetical protein PsorP6_017159 [Peronosclerospora sorghi]
MGLNDQASIQLRYWIVCFYLFLLLLRSVQTELSRPPPSPCPLHARRCLRCRRLFPPTAPLPPPATTVLSFSPSRSISPSRSVPASTFPRSTFQRLLVLFALTRTASFLTHGVARNLVNNAVLCLFFSLVLFQMLQWIDITPKLSRWSRRIWVAFRVANGLFYVTVPGLSLFHEAQVAKAR